jgi:hypothetical protein
MVAADASEVARSCTLQTFNALLLMCSNSFLTQLQFFYAWISPGSVHKTLSRVWASAWCFMPARSGHQVHLVRKYIHVLPVFSQQIIINISFAGFRSWHNPTCLPFTSCFFPQHFSIPLFPRVSYSVRCPYFWPALNN